MGNVWWYLTRITGVLAWVFASASVILGLTLSTRVAAHRGRARRALELHRTASALTLVYLALHLAALVGDGYADFGWIDLVVPFASDWRPAPVAAGVVAAWLLLAVQVTSWARARLPRGWWRRVHYASFGVYLLATWHALTAGSDARTSLFVLAVDASVLTVTVLTLWRIGRAWADAEPRSVLPGSGGSRRVRAAGVR